MVLCSLDQFFILSDTKQIIRNSTNCRNPDYINNGYGNKILKELIKICKKITKIKNLIAVIGGKNNYASIKIHKKNGFHYIGTIKKAGFKKNKWVDSIYMQKRL